MTAKPKNKSHWDKNNPAEVARDELRKAIKSGRMIRPDNCELCNTSGPTFGHHFKGYLFPLEVWFVCISCNTRLTVHDGSQTKENAKVQMSKNKATKTDNHNPGAKLALRKYFLEKYHADGAAKVFDCCQGGGVMWTALRETHPVASYWGVDVKPKKGRVKIDSVRVLQQGLTQTVIDIDTYGSPWKHWFALLSNLNGPKTVFLTIGSTMFKGATDGAVLAALGCVFTRLKLPETFYGRLDQIGVEHSLARGADHAILVEAVESVSTGNARYIGVRLEPKSDSQHVSDAGRQNTSVERN